MSITYAAPALMYAVVEYHTSAKHIYDPVTTPPEQEGQYRLVCLAPDSADAWRIAHLLCALSDGRYRYTVCPAEPESSAGSHDLEPPVTKAGLPLLPALPEDSDC